MNHARPGRWLRLGLLVGLATASVAAQAAPPVAQGMAPGQVLPFAAGERLVMRLSYAKILAGRAWMSVQAAREGERDVLEFVSEARSQGFFAWLFRFRVNDRTTARWDPATGCSLGIEKHLREGRAVRDQVVHFDPAGGTATVTDPKIKQTQFDVGPCALDILSAFFVTRVRGVADGQPLELPVFDNGKRYVLGVRLLERETVDLPAPLGPRVRTLVVEPQLVEGTGLFVKEKGARLRIWLTDDARRIPVRLRSKVAIGSVAADLESYEPGLR